MPFNVQLQNDSALTLTEQICQQVELSIAAEELTPNEALPSVRQLSIKLKINPNTVARAYQQLVHKGSLRSERGKGVFVANCRSKFSVSETSNRLQVAAQRFVADTRHLALSKQELLSAISAVLGDK